MQTVNFNCPHCGNLMAVGTNLLGRNVRCPHCKQVVRAPAAPGEPPAVQMSAPQAPPLTPGPPPIRVSTQVEHHESIFGERHDEDVFGSEPLKPTLPPVSAPPPPPAPTPPAPEPLYLPPPTPPAPHSLETLTYEAPPAPAPDEEPGTEPPVPAGRTYRPATARTAEAPATPAFAWILLGYSVLATVAAGVFAYQYFTAGPADHPFQAIPDFYGQYEKASRKQVSFQGLPDPKLDVPPGLRVKLGEEITVGDLQVRPTAVHQQVMALAREHRSKENVSNPAGQGLVLTLKVKNVSADTTFHPDDPAFNRAFEKTQPPPYTALQYGRDFYYGPFVWPWEEEIQAAYIDGYKPPAQPLGPGEERDVWVTVAPKGARVAPVPHIVDELKDAKNPGAPLLWRVQLRRGLVKARADDGKEVEVSATTVIGVEFRLDQIQVRN